MTVKFVYTATENQEKTYFKKQRFNSGTDFNI